MKETIKNFLQDIKQMVDVEIERILDNDNPMTDGLYKSAVYSATGGKRIRAVFTHLIGELFEIPKDKLNSPSIAIELVHAASLIMDDLPYMDDSQLRRGKPANHVVFGQDVALLASIALLSEASKILLEDNNLTAEENNKLTVIISRAYGFDGLAAGQFVDLKLKNKQVDFDIIKFINQKKTAALFFAAAQMAAVLGDADTKKQQAVEEFSADIGFAFQIVDDMLDVAGDEKIVGKNLTHDKMNFVKLVGIDEANRYLKEYQQKAEEALEVFGEKADKLKAFNQYLIERVA